MAKRRSNGEGSVFKETRSGKWIAKFQIGYDVKGNRVFKSAGQKPKKKQDCS